MGGPCAGSQIAELFPLRLVLLMAMVLRRLVRSCHPIVILGENHQGGRTDWILQTRR